MGIATSGLIHSISKASIFSGAGSIIAAPLSLIPFTFRLAEFGSSHITVNALHPGVIIGTEVTNTAFIKWGLPLKFGAATVMNLALNPELEV